MRNLLLGILALCPFACAQAADAAETKVVRDVRYSDRTDAACTGDLHLPACGANASQAVLLIHGGGWSAMDKRDVEGIAAFLVRDLGCAVFNVNYRLASPQHPWPACGEDCLAAAQFLLDGKAAEHGLRLKRIWIMGGSAGGHLALWTGLKLPADRVAGIVSISGIADPVPDAKLRPSRYRTLFGGREPTAADLDAMSILKLVRPNGPKILLTHEYQDDVVPINSARHFLWAYRSCGNDIGLCEYSRNSYEGLTGHCIWVPGTRPRRLLPKLEREIASFMQPPAVPEPKPAWDFERSTEGWYRQPYGGGEVAWQDGALTFVINRPQYYSIRQCVQPFEAVRYTTFAVRMRVTPNARDGLAGAKDLLCRLKWGTAESPIVRPTLEVGPGNEAVAKVVPDGAWHEYRLKLDAAQGWRGRIDELWFKAADINHARVAIDWMRFE